MKVIHNIITKFMVVLFFVSMCCMDSENLLIPISAFAVSGLYLAILGYRSGALFGSVEENDK